MGKEKLCLIPARGGSKRLKRKNLKQLAGKPLIAYSIEAAVESDIFDRVVVSTEDTEIATVAEEYGATVPFTRPSELASDTAQVVDVTDHALEYFSDRGTSIETFAVLLPTTPLRTAEDLKNAYQKFVDNPEAEFLMCVTDFAYSPFEALHEQDGILKRYWDHDYIGQRSQEKPDLIVDNGAAYIMDREAYERERTFHGESLIGYHMPRERSIDIDEEVDLKIAEFFIEQ